MGAPDGVVVTIRSYERWRARRIPIDATELEERYRRLARSPWDFARGAYFRFVEQVAELRPRLGEAPAALAAGDLHLESAGTWRDRAGRLVWGLVDLDEVDLLPWPLDLVRLASSAMLAAEAGRLDFDPPGICAAVLEGWGERIAARHSQPVVLGPDHRDLLALHAPLLRDPLAFTEELAGLEPYERALPKPAGRMLAAVTPPGDPAPRLLRGRGRVDTLGARRIVVVSRIDGGPLVREAAQVPGPVSLWQHPSRAQVGGLVAVVDAARGVAAEPARRQSRKWIVRGLDGALTRLALSDEATGPDGVTVADPASLLAALAGEAADLHRCAIPEAAARKVVRRDAAGRSPGWLLDAAEAIAEATRADHAALAGALAGSGVATLLGTGAGDAEHGEGVRRGGGDGGG